MCVVLWFVFDMVLKKCIFDSLEDFMKAVMFTQKQGNSKDKVKVLG